MKRYDFTVPENAQGTRLFPCACRMLPQVPAYALRRAFQKRDVKVDGHRVDLSAMASPGTQVCIYTDEARVKTVPVVYQDENVLVAVKPAGVSCEPDRRGGKTFPQLLCEQLGPGTAEPLLCHRLDNPTEGLLLLARTPEAQQAAQDAFRRGEVRKEYECLVRGTPSPHHAVLEAWLVKDALHARVRVLAREAEGAKRIITEYDVLRPPARQAAHGPHSSDPCAYGFHRPSASGRRPVWRPGFQPRDEGPSAYAMRRVAHAANLRAAGLLKWAHLYRSPLVLMGEEAHA